MSTLLKILVALGVALPLAGFVAGSLVAASDHPPNRERIVIQDDSTPTAPGTADPRREKDPGRQPPTDDSDDLGAGEDDDTDDDTDDGIRGTRGSGDADQSDERDDEAITNGGGDDDTDDDDTDDSGEDDD